MQWVVDASVAVKWIFPDKQTEEDVEPAVALLQSIRAGNTKLLQPPHWLAEVAAVCVRLNSGIAQAAVEILHAMEFPIADSPEIYARACAMAERLEHHLFDTLYHAVALAYQDTVLITADQRYFRKAKRYGSIMPLAEFVGER